MRGARNKKLHGLPESGERTIVGGKETYDMAVVLNFKDMTCAKVLASKMLLENDLTHYLPSYHFTFRGVSGYRHFQISEPKYRVPFPFAANTVLAEKRSCMQSWIPAHAGKRPCLSRVSGGACFSLGVCEICILH